MGAIFLLWSRPFQGFYLSTTPPEYLYIGRVVPGEPAHLVLGRLRLGDRRRGLGRLRRQRCFYARWRRQRLTRLWDLRGISGSSTIWSGLEQFHLVCGLGYRRFL